MVEQPGQVAAFEVAPLFAKVTGYVQKLNVDLGDEVRGPKYDNEGKQTAPGQVLCELAIPELNEEHAQKLALIEQAREDFRLGRVHTLEESEAYIDAELDRRRQARATA